MGAIADAGRTLIMAQVRAGDMLKRASERMAEHDGVWLVEDVYVIDLAVRVLHGEVGGLDAEMLAACVERAARGTYLRWRERDAQLPLYGWDAMRLAEACCGNADALRIDALRGNLRASLG